jgi:general secretion pathway protein D
VAGIKQSITLNVNQDITLRDLFVLSEELLNERGVGIEWQDNIFRLRALDGSGPSGDVVYAYGKTSAQVPNTTLDVVMLVPFSYGFQSKLTLIIPNFAKVELIADDRQKAFMIRGKRREVIKALEFIELMDQPDLRNRLVSAFEPVFVPVEEARKKLAELLTQEGIYVGSNASDTDGVSIVVLERTGTMIIFAPNDKTMGRISFWLDQVDKPISGAEFQYFYYQPQLSRATDLGESISRLIGSGGSTRSELSGGTSASTQNNSQSSARGGSLSVGRGVEEVSMVVDERANALIFYTTGQRYQQILPLIKRLDILPKQVMLEVVIAEVTLTDEFKQGVEFGLANGNYGLSTEGAFMGSGFGGLSYLLTGADGRIAMNVLQSNSLVNILSRPTLVVRDGVSADITVGTDIPIVGSTTSDPISGDRQTTNIEYRTTGVQLTVLPTINAQGVVIMEINQRISNQVDSGSSASVNPSVFERAIKTEVVAETGQTVILGGLISESRSEKRSQVPGLGSIPVLGKLFGADTAGSDKTELIVMVTPRIISDTGEWESLKSELEAQMKSLRF